MRVRMLAIVVVCGSLAGGGLAFAAAVQTAAAGEAVEIISTGAQPSALAAEPVTNEPFSAVWTMESTRTLADGTKVTHHGHHAVYRDSEGRVRLEQRLTNGKDGKPEIKMIYVKDPVAHTLTVWMVNGPGPRVASVVKLPAEKKNVAAMNANERAARESQRPQPVVTTQDLGSQVFDDVAVTGVLKTTVVPAGRSGNDQPITKTHEIWTSQEMQLIFKQRQYDPRTGERIVQLADFSRAEPDAALFRPPTGYEVKSALETLKDMMAKLEAAQE